MEASVPMMATLRTIVTVLALAAGLLAGPTAGPASAESPRHPDDTWLDAAYSSTLDRLPTSAQKRARLAQLAAGTSRRAVADELVRSVEHARVIVDRQYRRVLGRSPSAGDRTYWVGRLQAGEGVRTTTSFLYGSPEVFGRAGGTDEDWVRFLYADVLGRTASEVDVDYWTGRLAAGEVRTALARAWLGTPEATGLQVQVLFRELAYRPPTAAEVTTWSGHLRRVDVRRVTAALLATAAFAVRSGSPGAPAVLAVGNGHSTEPSISADGRIVAFQSAASNLTASASPVGIDVFVYDRVTGRLRAITAGNGDSVRPEVSADGSTVVFTSAATNLVAGDANGQSDVFRTSTTGGPIERLSDGNRASFGPSVSGDGAVVAFSSSATDLVADDPNGEVSDVYVVGVGDGLVREGDDSDDPTGSVEPQVSADGSVVTFNRSTAHLLTVGAGPAVPIVNEGAWIPFAASPSADGSRLALTEAYFTGGSVVGRVVVATVAADGTVSSSQPVQASWYKPTGGRLSDDGSAVLAHAADLSDNPGLYADRLALTSGQPLRAGPFGAGSDLTADGGLVVSTRSSTGQATRIVLHETR